MNSDRSKGVLNPQGIFSYFKTSLLLCCCLFRHVSCSVVFFWGGALCSKCEGNAIKYQIFISKSAPVDGWSNTFSFWFFHPWHNFILINWSANILFLSFVLFAGVLVSCSAPKCSIKELHCTKNVKVRIEIDFLNKISLVWKWRLRKNN